jgi:hypothetical protein
VALGGEYNKTNLKQAHYPLGLISKAICRAELLDAGVVGGDIPVSNTTRVHQLIKAIVGKALPSQVPLELRSLIDAK